MKALVCALLVFALAAAPTCDAGDRVVVVRMPDDNVEVRYVEGDPFTVVLRSKGTSVEGVRYYVGDGVFAVELVAHPSQGIFFLGQRLEHGHVFKKGSTVAIPPGYKLRKDLMLGDTYVELPGVKFQPSEKP